jgi:hypothetical protein
VSGDVYNGGGHGEGTKAEEQRSGAMAPEQNKGRKPGFVNVVLLRFVAGVRSSGLAGQKLLPMTSEMAIGGHGTFPPSGDHMVNPTSLVLAITR